MKLSENKIMRHLCVSFTCGAIEYISFISLAHFLDVNVFYSHILSFSLATGFGFLGHSFFTFKVGSLKVRNASFFMIQVLTALLLSVFLLKYFLSFNFSIYISKALQMCVTFGFNFLFGYLISFKNENNTHIR